MDAAVETLMAMNIAGASATPCINITGSTAATATCTGRKMMRPIPEAVDVTEDDRLQCRALIEAAGFYAVDYEDDGACWERLLPNGDCLVLAVWKSGLFGKPERKEWTLVRYTGRGTPGDETGPMTLHEALSRVTALTARSRMGV